MIYVFYTRFTSRLKTESFDFYFQQLPSDIQYKILRFRHWEDAHRTLLGRTLLMYGLQHLGLTGYSLGDIKYTKFDKPYFDDPINFNIAHSGQYILCAISRTHRIGVDVEEIKSISLDDFTDNFSEQEWEEILKKDKFQGFYKYWTQKEAFLKAVGMGLNIPLNRIEIVNKKVSWEGDEWFLEEIKLDENYVAFLASDIPGQEIVIKKINYN